MFIFLLLLCYCCCCCFGCGCCCSCRFASSILQAKKKIHDNPIWYECKRATKNNSHTYIHSFITLHTHTMTYRFFLCRFLCNLDNRKEEKNSFNWIRCALCGFSFTGLFGYCASWWWWRPERAYQKWPKLQTQITRTLNSL